MILHTRLHNHVRKDGLQRVIIVIYFDGETLTFPTGVYCTFDKFDSNEGVILGYGKAAKDQNLLINNTKSRLNNIIVKYRLQEKKLTPQQLKYEFENPSFYVNFIAFLKKEIRRREKDLEISPTSANQHMVLARKLEDYDKYRKKSLKKSKTYDEPIISFSEIDNKFLSEFRSFLRNSKNNSVNTVANNLKNLKAYLTIARKRGIISINPFDNFDYHKVETDIIYLTEVELNRLVELYNKKELKDNYQRTLRHFLFMCFTGIRISDFGKLTFDNIEGNKLIFVQTKTRNAKQTHVSIPLSNAALRLIKDEGNKTGRIFSKVADSTFNVHLKTIALHGKIKKSLIAHAARHTFASLFIEKTDDIVSLQKLLGHARISETMKYVHISREKIERQAKKYYDALGIIIG